MDAELKQIAEELKGIREHLKVIADFYGSPAEPEDKPEPEETHAGISAKLEVKKQVVEEPAKTKYCIYRKTPNGELLNESFIISAVNDNEAIKLASLEAEKRGWGEKNWTGDKVK